MRRTIARESQLSPSAPVPLHQTAGAGNPASIAVGTVIWTTEASTGSRMTASVKALRGSSTMR